jgi:hypothetical protein
MDAFALATLSMSALALLDACPTMRPLFASYTASDRLGSSL